MVWECSFASRLEVSEAWNCSMVPQNTCEGRSQNSPFSQLISLAIYIFFTSSIAMLSCSLQCPKQFSSSNYHHHGHVYDICVLKPDLGPLLKSSIITLLENTPCLETRFPVLMQPKASVFDTSTGRGGKSGSKKWGLSARKDIAAYSESSTTSWKFSKHYKEKHAPQIISESCLWLFWPPRCYDFLEEIPWLCLLKWHTHRLQQSISHWQRWSLSNQESREYEDPWRMPFIRTLRAINKVHTPMFDYEVTALLP